VRRHVDKKLKTAPTRKGMRRHRFCMAWTTSTRLSSGISTMRVEKRGIWEDGGRVDEWVGVRSENGIELTLPFPFRETEPWKVGA